MCSAANRMRGEISHRQAWYFYQVESLRWDNVNTGSVSPVFARLVQVSREHRWDGLLDLLPSLRSLVWINSCQAHVDSYVGHMQPYSRTSIRVSRDMEVSYQVHCTAIMDAANRLDDFGAFLDTMKTIGSKPHTLKILMPGFREPAKSAEEDLALRLNHSRFYAKLTFFLLEYGSNFTGLHVSTGAFNPVHTLLPYLNTSLLANLTSVTLEILLIPSKSELPVLPRLRSLSLAFNIPMTPCIDWARQLSCPNLEHLTLSFNTSGKTANHRSQISDPRYCAIPLLIFTQGVCQSDYFHTITSFALEYDHPPLLTFYDQLGPQDKPAFSEWQKDVRSQEMDIAGAQQDLLDAILRKHPFPRVRDLSLSLSNSWGFTTLFLATQSLLAAHYRNLHTLTIALLPALPGERARVWEYPLLPTLAIVGRTVENLPELRSLTMDFVDQDLCEEGYAATTIGTTPRGLTGPCRQLRHWNVLNSQLDRNCELKKQTRSSRVASELIEDGRGVNLEKKPFVDVFKLKVAGTCMYEYLASSCQF